MRVGALVTSLAVVLCSGVGVSTAQRERAAASGPRYVVLAWNDLGMHCYNGSFADMMVLPPYNTLWAQVVEVADPPRIVTSGVSVTYEFPENTYSAGKTDFWEYATKAFSLPTTLPPNIGLKGKGLSGAMDPAGDHFTAVGIPLTEYTDADTSTRQPFQKAVITVRDSASGAFLTQAVVVAPVSSEMSCDMCHADGADATTRYPITPTGDFQKNILALHDYLNRGKYPAGHTAPLLGRRPVLCAECHADAALGMPGIKGVENLSNAMHRHHNPTNAPDITPDTNGCYSCHPGPDTKCLRCVMSQRYNMGCVDCHGDITQVAKNPSPWLNEPTCGNAACHGAGFATDQPLYRNSKGHGGTYCAGCHDSPHAIATSREPNDAIKFFQLQGSAGTLYKCTTCHATMPVGAFHHAASVTKAQVYLTPPTCAGTVRAGATLAISGALLPKHSAAARTVQIRITRLVGRSWVGARTLWAKNVPKTTYTQYAVSTRLARGTYRISAFAPADADHAATGPTAYRTLVVK